MQINIILLSSSFLPITIKLDFYAKINIINYTFTLKYNLQQVTNKSPRLQYLNRKIYKSLKVFKVPI